MKKTFILSILALLLVGCSKKSSNNPVTPGPSTPSASVSFSIRLESGTEGMIFSAKPSADVKIAEAVASLPAQNFTDPNTNPNPETVFPKDQWFHVGEYTGVDSGQKWAFKFTGKIASTGAPFIVNATYDVP